MRAITTTTAILLTLSLATAAAAFDGFFAPEFYEGPFCLAYGPEPDEIVFESSITGDRLEFGPDRIHHAGECDWGTAICHQFILEVRPEEVPDGNYDSIEGYLGYWEGGGIGYWGQYSSGRDWVDADRPEGEDPDPNLLRYELYKTGVPGFIYHDNPGATNDVMRWFVDTGDCFYVVILRMHVV